MQLLCVCFSPCVARLRENAVIVPVFFLLRVDPRLSSLFSLCASLGVSLQGMLLKYQRVWSALSFMGIGRFGKQPPRAQVHVPQSEGNNCIWYGVYGARESGVVCLLLSSASSLSCLYGSFSLRPSVSFARGAFKNRVLVV